MKEKKFSRNWRKSALTALLVSLSLSTVGGLVSCNEEPEETVPGLGVFYYDAGTDEYQLALDDNYKATFIAKGESKSATYTIEGNVLKLKFDKDGSEMTATLGEDALTLNYDNGEYKFFKKIYYTVSYEEVGGTDVADTTVVNGQTFAMPTAPQKPGYEFLGWYLDSEYKTPYSFSQIVTGDITLYAQWALVDPSAVEYEVDFDLGYDAQNPANMTTYAGKLYNAPTPTREGYKFLGWWISMYEDGNKLTYKYNENTVFTANTTLFALWEAENLGSKVSDPEVQVTETGVEWAGVKDVSMYKLKVTGPRGFNTVDEDVSGTSRTIDFANAPAGDYEISVTAIAQSGAENNSDTVKRYYKNKAVGRVSQFTVLDGMTLLFNRVENATTYYITIDCGNDAHNHTTYNIGDSTYYNFSACEMQEGGIRFTVTAAAEGLASTTSETFVYNKALDKVTGLSVDEDTQVLSWYPVANATNYIVTVACGDDAHTHQVINNGSKTSFSLKECPADANGKVTVSVYPQTTGYSSPAATEYVYDKTKLAAPGNISFSNVDGVYTLTWKAVTGATKYSVKIGNTVLTTTTNKCDITTALSWVDEATYNVEIKAENDENESVWSDTIVVRYGAMNPSIIYKEGKVTWKPAVGATGYQVRVNSDELQNYGYDVTSADITFNQEGTNTIYVRFTDSTRNYYSSWVSIEVENVRTLVFDSRGGSPVETMYKAMGDKLELPKPTKEGYDFAGWYNTPKGPESNGAKYEADYFMEPQELVLYAYWTPAKYKLDYVVGVNGTLPDGAEGYATYTQGYKLDVPTVEDGSKVFLGWFAGPDSGAQQLTDDRGNSLRAWNVKSGMTVYAHYVTDVLSFTLLEDGTYSVMKGRNVSKVTAITIPETYNNIAVTVVDGKAFELCAKLVSLTIPDTVKLVESDTAFQGCYALEEINVYHVDGNNTPVYSSVDGVLIKQDNITGQTQLDYYPASRGGTYAIPEGVTEIPLRLFDSSKVEEVIIPTSVAIIRERAFVNCQRLENITFVSGGTDTLTIEDGAFMNCTKLVEITLPNRLAELQLDEETRSLTLFSGCEGLQYVNVEKGSMYYSSVEGVLTNSNKTKLLYCPAARKGSYTIPRGIVEVGESAFYGCTMLTEIVIPGYVEEIEDYAFYGCSKVSRIVFDEGAIAGMELNVGAYAFADMTNLKSIEFNDGSMVTTLGEYAFANAAGLRQLMIPASMTFIGEYAFDNAKNLALVEFAENGADLTFGNYVFNDCKNLTRVDLPASVVKLNLGVFDGCVNISEVKVHEDNEYYKDEDGIVLSKDGKELLFFPKGRQPVDETTGEYVIPEGVETISDGAFKGMRYITKIVINNTVTHIGKNAFAESLQLDDLTFEAGNDEAALVIDESAFEGCAKIQSVALPARTEIIAAKAFYNVSISEVTFPEGVKEIGDYAFSKSSLTSVEIPAGLETLGIYVFDSCVVLDTVTFATGFNATEIPVGMFQNTAIRAISIPGSVEKIGYAAFNECKQLSTVTFEDGTADLIIGYLPEGMESDDSAASGKEDEKDKGTDSAIQGVFLGTVITEIAIPDRTVYIGKSAFANCSTLATVTITENSRLQRIGARAFSNCGKLKSIYLPKTLENTPYVNEQTAQEYAIGMSAFYNAGLTEVTFGLGGTGELSFSKEAFAGTPLTQLNLPNRVAPIYADNFGVLEKVEGISRDMFGSNLTDVNVEAGGEYYGSNDGVLYAVKDGVLAEMVFIPAAKTGTVTVPKTVSFVRDYAASYSKISAIEFEDTENADGIPLTFGNNVFTYCANLVSVRFPERTVAIGNSVFYSGMTKLQSVYFPTNVESIGASICRGATALTTVEFGENCKLKAIPDYAFWGCNKITSIKVPANVEKIGTYAFRDCSAVTSFTFEEGSQLKSLTGAVFQGMALTELAIPDSVTSLDGNVFSNMSYLKRVYLPAGFTSISTIGNQQQSNFLFDNCTSLQEVIIDSANPYFKSVDGVVYTKDGKTLIYFPRAKKIGSENLNEDGTGKGTYDGVYKTPDGVQTIGTYAFKSNSNIKELIISKDLMFIQREAFKSSYIAKLTFEERESTLTIGDQAFYSCTLLGNSGKDTLTIPAEVEIDGDWAFFSTRYGYVVFEDNNTTRNLMRTFQSCTYLKSVTNIPSTVSVMSQTFASCTQLASVTFSMDGAISVMEGTFYNCKALTSIELPTVGTIKKANVGYGVFESCTNLTEVKIKGCGYLGDETFYGCTKLANFVMPDDVSQVGAKAFYNCTALTSVTLSSGLDTIGAEAFYNCNKLTSISIGGFVTSIGDSAFRNCTALTSVTLPDGLSSIGNYAFYGANKVANLVIPDGVQTIGDYAFYNWKGLTELSIPSSVKTIGTYAFYGCSNVETINIPEGEGLESIGDYAFEGMSKVTEFFIPVSLMDIGVGVFNGWESLDNVVVEGGNLAFAYDNGIVYNANYTAMIIITPKVKGDVVVPATVTELAKGVFRGTAITSITLPDTITVIPEEAFRDCILLTEIKLPKYLETIGVAAFANCTSLTEITIPASVRSTFEKEPTLENAKDGGEFVRGYYEKNMVDGIGAYAFAGCDNLQTLKFQDGGAQRLSIGDYAFYGCSKLVGEEVSEGVYELRIPNRVRGDAIPQMAWNNGSGGNAHRYTAQGIGAYAFARCISLESVVFEEKGIATFSEPLLIKIGAFTECTALQSVTFSSALSDVVISLFDGGRAYTDYGAAAIQARAFAGCTQLTNVTFPTDYTKFKVVNSAFADSTNLTLPKELVLISASEYSITGGEKPGESYSCWADNYYLINGCAYDGDSCTFYISPSKYGLR